MPKGSETKRKLHIIEVINKCYQDDIGKVQWKKKTQNFKKASKCVLGNSETASWGRRHVNWVLAKVDKLYWVMP